MSIEPRPKKLLEQVDDAIRLMHYSPRTEETYVHWIRRFVRVKQPTRSVRRGKREELSVITKGTRASDGSFTAQTIQIGGGAAGGGSAGGNPPPAPATRQRRRSDGRTPCEATVCL